jgi:hypothetical protein
MSEEQFSQLCKDTSFLLGQEEIDNLGKYGKITIQNSAVTVFLMRKLIAVKSLFILRLFL